MIKVFRDDETCFGYKEAHWHLEDTKWVAFKDKHKIAKGIYVTYHNPGNGIFETISQVILAPFDADIEVSVVPPYPDNGGSV